MLVSGRHEFRLGLRNVRFCIISLSDKKSLFLFSTETVMIMSSESRELRQGQKDLVASGDGASDASEA